MREKLPTGSLPTAPLMTCLALMSLALGDRERAANLYPLLKTFRGQHYWFLVDRVLGELATLLKNWEMAAMYLDAAEKTAEREGLRPELARALLARADFEVARGGQGSIMRAAESLSKAPVLFEQLNMPVAAARTHGRLHLLHRDQRRGNRFLKQKYQHCPQRGRASHQLPYPALIRICSQFLCAWGSQLLDRFPLSRLYLSEK